MKNTTNLLLTLSLPLLLINCTGKNTPSTAPKVQTTTPQISTQNNQPSLGRPISIPIKRPVLTQNRPLPHSTPPIQQTPKVGESYFSKKFTLNKKINETSGLIKVDNRLWTLNDSGGEARLYQVNEQNGQIIKSLKIQNAHNQDWEDIAYDDTYVYIGDFGNNRGNRKDLKIYKIPRSALRTKSSTRAEIIHFKYSDQKDFRKRTHKHNYDCEAMVAHNGKLYLFSKNWLNYKTRLYELSTEAGKHQARYIATFNTQGMVTGASINKELNILLLTTYSSLLNVNVWAFTNFTNQNFFAGNKKQLNFNTPLQGQVEGVTFTNNYKAYLSSEAFTKYIFSFDASLYELDFSGEFD